MVKQFEDVYDVSFIDEKLEKEDECETEIEFTEEDYHKWYLEQCRIANVEFSDFEKHKSKTFDDIVNKYEVLIGLHGASYINATRMMFYSVIANQLKLNMFTIESNKIDIRIPLLLQLKAGHGKKNYERFIRKTCEGLGKQYQEPTSYHPEQFVGKIIVHETKDDAIYLPILGTLASDFMVVDEAHALLTRKENEEVLRYMRTALDPIGDNTIEKKQVNVPNEEKLKYNPICTIILFTQPISNVNEELLIRGSLRRFANIIVNTTLEERMNARRESKFLSLKEDVHNKIWDKWIEFNKVILEYKNLKYVCQDFSRIDDYLDDLGINARDVGPEVLEFYNTAQFTIKMNIFKMAIVRAAIEHRDGDTVNIKIEHINAAIKDWQLIWVPQVHWIAQQMVIKSIKPLQWKDDFHGLIVNMLSREMHKSCDSKILIDMFCNIHQTKNARKRAYSTLNDLKKWGWIKRESSGKKNGHFITLLREC